MAKHKVLLDRGVVIGGRHYPHGSTVDSDALVAKYEAPAFVAPELSKTADSEAKAAHTEAVNTLKAQHDENVKKAMERNAEAKKQADAAFAQCVKEGLVELTDKKKEA